MDSPDSSAITELLHRWGAGEEACLNELIPLVDRELRRIAHHLMRKERQGHSLQTTALVNEAYMKLVDQPRATWQNRAQFFGIAASLMRRILVDHARGLQRNKRGGAAEAAEALHVHPNTVVSDWSMARAWLKRELTRGKPAHAG